MNKFLRYSLSTAAAIMLMSSCVGCVLYKKLPTLSFSDESLLTVITHSNTNRGLPFYVLIKEVEKAAFLIDSYDDVVHKTLNAKEAYPYIVSQVLIPGETYTFKQPRGERGTPLGVYFFFTDVRKDWKVLVDPTVAETKIDLLGSEIQVKESR